MLAGERKEGHHDDDVDEEEDVDAGGLSEERKSSMAMWLVKGGQDSVLYAPRLARMPARVVSWQPLRPKRMAASSFC